MAPELPFYAVATDGTVPIFMAGPLAGRPAPGQPNRLYLVTDAATPYLVRDSGAAWSTVGSSEQAASILEKLLTVDADDSGLNANFLQGKAAVEFLLKAGGTMTAALILAGDPTAALHAASKQYVDAVRTYVDSILSGLDAKPDVRLASNTNHVLTGAQTVDGVSVVTGDRILLKNQTAGAENGIWVASTTGAWTRATDADTATKIKDMYTFVAEGAVGGNRDTGWLLTTDVITLGTTALVYGQFSGPGSTLAGTGLTRSGNTISASFGTAANTIAQGNDARLRTIRDEGVALTNRAILDFIGTGVIVEDDPATGRTKVTISGAAAGAASEAAPGITQQGTAQQIINGTPGNLFPTAERLAVELDRRGPMNAECELSRSANQAVATSMLTNVLWNSEVLDPRNWHDNATNAERITPDAAGRYSGVVYTIWAASTAVSVRRVRILKWVGGVANLVADNYIGLGTAGQYVSTGPQMVAFNTLMALGDYLTVEVFQSTGAALNLDPASTFSMARVL